MIKKGLGKGLGALIINTESEETGIRELKINEIEPNLNQPRKHFDDNKLLQLSESIKQHGIVQPIIVKKENESYKIVAGERRWRAARMAGFSTVPVIIKDIGSKQVMEIALIENLQRQDLNPVEEAEAFEKLLNEFNMTQEDISKIVGRSRPAIANSLRLLNLDDKIKEHIINEEISSGHARAIMSIDDKTIQNRIIEEIIKNQLSVRETEALVKKLLSKKAKNTPKKRDEQIIEIEEKFKNIFGTKVQLISSNKKGKIVIEYYSNEELDRIIEIVNNMEK